MVRGELACLPGAAGLQESRVMLWEQRSSSAAPSPAAKPCLQAHCTGQHRGALHDTTAARRRVAGLPLVLHGYRDTEFEPCDPVPDAVVM